jgi:hypothetical protein
LVYSATAQARHGETCVAPGHQPRQVAPSEETTLMGWAARLNPLSKANELARTDRAKWLIAHLGRTAVEEQLALMSPADQVIVQKLLDELHPVVMQ